MDNASVEQSFPFPSGREPVRLPSLPRRHPLVERIMSEAIEEDIVLKYRRRAQFTFFCGAEPEVLAGYDGQLEIVGRCLEWFVFDCLIPDLELTPVEIWFDNYGDSLDEKDLEMAGNYLDFILGIFEIGNVLVGKGFTAIDLLRDEKVYPVYEDVISEEIEPGQLLLARLYPRGSHYILSGMAVIMSPLAMKDIRLLISNGKLIPDQVLSRLDGVELENLFGRSLHELEDHTGFLQAEKRLKRYLSEVYNAGITYGDLELFIRDGQAMTDLEAFLDESIPFFNRHERELIISLSHILWRNSHPGA